MGHAEFNQFSGPTADSSTDFPDSWFGHKWICFLQPRPSQQQQRGHGGLPRLASLEAGLV